MLLSLCGGGLLRRYLLWLSRSISVGKVEVSHAQKPPSRKIDFASPYKAHSMYSQTSISRLNYSYHIPCISILHPLYLSHGNSFPPRSCSPHRRSHSSSHRRSPPCLQDSRSTQLLPTRHQNNPNPQSLSHRSLFLQPL